jgi:hypothetical protein
VGEGAAFSSTERNTKSLQDGRGGFDNTNANTLLNYFIHSKYFVADFNSQNEKL